MTFNGFLNLFLNINETDISVAFELGSGFPGKVTQIGLLMAIKWLRERLNNSEPVKLKTSSKYFWKDFNFTIPVHVGK